MLPHERRELRAVRTPDRGVPVPGRRDRVEEQRRGRERLEVLERVEPVVPEPRQVPLEHRQAASLVAGDRAEREVPRDDAEVAGVPPRVPVAAQVRGARVVEPARPQHGDERLRQGPLGLLAARVALGDHLVVQAKRLVLASDGGEPVRGLGAHARVAVAVLVVGGDLQLGVRGLGLVGPAVRRGRAEPGHDDAAAPHAGPVVPLRHVVEHRVDLLGREDGVERERARHPLVVPQQVPADLGARRREALGVAVVHAHAPRERRQHRVGVPRHVRRRGEPHPGPVLPDLVLPLDRERERLVQQGPLVRTERRLVDLLEQGVDAAAGGLGVGGVRRHGAVVPSVRCVVGVECVVGRVRVSGRR